MSTSPDCRAVKRCCDVSGTYFTFSASPKSAAAVARQTSMSRPLHLPWPSTRPKPAMPPPGTPQIRAPRALMVSRSLPAMAWPETNAAAKPMAPANEYLPIVLPPFLRETFPECHLGRACKQQAKCSLPRPKRTAFGSRPPRSDGGLADRFCVLQAALAPQRVQATLDLERAAHADVALEALAVVTDLLDDVVDPLLVDAERLAHAGRDAEDALDRGILALHHFVDILRRDVVFLGLDHCVLRPAHDVAELVVAVPEGWCQRLLGDDLGQDDEVLGLGRRRHVGGPRRIKTRAVA